MAEKKKTKIQEMKVKWNQMRQTHKEDDEYMGDGLNLVNSDSLNEMHAIQCVNM